MQSLIEYIGANYNARLQFWRIGKGKVSIFSTGEETWIAAAKARAATPSHPVANGGFIWAIVSLSKACR
jgi:hypothetical protein